MSVSVQEFLIHRKRLREEAGDLTPASFEPIVSDLPGLVSQDWLHWQSLWFFRPQHDFPPDVIRHPEEYSGGRFINIACTQTGLKPSEQKRLVQSWCDFLPGLDDVSFVWFSSRVTQGLFDAAVRIKNLRGLYVKWSGLTSIDSIVNARALRYLHIGSSPSLAPLTPLHSLPDLVWLELENIRACSSLDFVSALTGLRGLSIAGDGNSIKYLQIKSLAPLTCLQNLNWLSLSTADVEGGDLQPLVSLRALRNLNISNKYPMEEVARLAGSRPEVSCDVFEPISGVHDFFTCRKCGHQGMVMPVGKGKALMCPCCEKDRIDSHSRRFLELACAAYNGQLSGNDGEPER